MGTGPTIGLVHGFTLTGRCWGPLAGALASHHRVLAVDAPGHGDSGHADAGLWSAADLLVETVGFGTYVGYSMGARMVLHAALAHPGSVEALVLISGTAGISDPAERARRRAADEGQARHIIDVGVDSFTAEWVSKDLFSDVPLDALDLDERRRNTAIGLATSLRSVGAGRQEPLWDRLPQLDMRVLIVVGALDLRFVAAGRRMAESIGTNAKLVEISGAGHTAHRSRPDAVIAALRDFI